MKELTSLLREQLKEARGKNAGNVGTGEFSTNTQRDDNNANYSSGKFEESSVSTIRGNEGSENGASKNSRISQGNNFGSRQPTRNVIGSGASTDEDKETSRIDRLTKSFNRGKKVSELKENVTKILDVLTDKEIAEKRGKFQKALERYFLYIDQYLWEKKNDRNQIPIWTQYDDEEITSIVNCLMMLGKHDAMIAKGIRAVTEGNDIAVTAIFFSSRTFKTIPILFGKKR